MQPAVVALAQRIETDLLSLYPQFTANTPVGSTATPPTEQVIDAAETALFCGEGAAERLQIPGGGLERILRPCDKFRDSANSTQPVEAGLKALVDGNVGKMKDFFIFRLAGSCLATGAGPVTTHNLAFTKDAIGLVVRRLPQPLPGTGAIAEYAEMGNFGLRVVMSYQPNTLAQQFTVDVLYGCAVLRNGFAVQVNS